MKEQPSAAFLMVTQFEGAVLQVNNYAHRGGIIDLFILKGVMVWL